MTTASTPTLTEADTAREVDAGGTTIRYHEAGEGEPILFLHSYGPGSHAWTIWHRVLPAFAAHYRCILMDMPNYGGTGPVRFEDPHHKVDARVALALLDELGIDRAHVVGNSQGGQAAMVFAYSYPERVRRLVWGAGHIGTMGGYRNEYLFSNAPEEGERASNAVYDDPSLENFLTYLKVHLFDESLATEELASSLRERHLARPDLIEAMFGSISTPYDHSPHLGAIQAPTLIVWGRNDRMCTVEIGFNALNLTPGAQLLVMRETGHWPPYERPVEYSTQVLAFLAAEDEGEPQR